MCYIPEAALQETINKEPFVIGKKVMLTKVK
jgi:hypothetical protein